MPNWLTPRNPHEVATRQLAGEQTHALARLEGQTAREVARIDSITDVTESGLFAAAEIAHFTNHLIERTPFAETELAFIARAGIGAIGKVVARSGRCCP